MYNNGSCVLVLCRLQLGGVLGVALAEEVDVDPDGLAGVHVLGRGLDLGVAEEHLGLDLSGRRRHRLSAGLRDRLRDLGQVHAQRAALLHAGVAHELRRNINIGSYPAMNGS